ncbi:MAG: hypothetical protein K2N87_00820 [Eubacterium sp.]|nr:hypothetical protein [Eubacterium sp.]
MKSMYDIAMIGESMSGKSTWISALFKQDVYKKLNAKCETNESGQTKISVSYILMNPDENNLQVQNINWNIDNLINYDKSKEGNASMNSLLEILGVTNTLSTAKTPAAEQTDLEKYIQTYLNGAEYKSIVKGLSVEYVFDIINNKEINDMNLISYIEVSGPADTEIWEIIEKYGLDGVKIRDTRGFLDDSFTWFQKQDEKLQDERKNNDTILNENFEGTDPTEQGVQKLLDDRNIYGVDACMFMGIARSNSLNKEISKKYYGTLISYMLKNHPTFLTVRDQELTKILINQLSSENTIVYEEAYNKLKKDMFSDGFEPFKKLLKSFGLFEKSSNIRTTIAQKHYTELIIPDIPDRVKQKLLQKSEKIYRICVKETFSCALAKISEYYKNIESAEQCLKEIDNEFKKTLIKLYDEEFISGLSYGYPYYWNKHFRYNMEYLSNKVQGPYYGGLVGVYGGLTTWTIDGRVGQAAIDYLETAYGMRSILYDKIPDALEPAITRYIKTVLPNDTHSSAFSDAVNKMKQSIAVKLSQKLNSDYECLSCTYRMVKRENLASAQKCTCEELQAKPSYIGKYLPELKNCFPHENWTNNMFFVSVVKQMLWHLVDTKI